MGRSRDEILKDALNKTLEMMKNMDESDDIAWTQETISVTKDLYLEINCHRDDDDDSCCFGKTYGFEVYAIKKGVAIDCMTINAFRDRVADITYLLNCYI